MKSIDFTPIPELIDYYKEMGPDEAEMTYIISDIMQEQGLDSMLIDGCLDPQQVFQARVQVFPEVLSLFQQSDQAISDEEANRLIATANDGLEALVQDVFSQARKKCDLCLKESCLYREGQPSLNAVHNHFPLHIDQTEVIVDKKAPEIAEDVAEPVIDWFGENN